MGQERPPAPVQAARVTTPPAADPAYLCAVRELADLQAGVVGRSQLVALGIPRAFVRRELRARRWQRVHPRTYVTFTGPLPFPTRVWAAICYAGEDAVASHGTAAFLAGLVDDEPDRIDVTVRHGHRVAERPGLRIHQSRLLAATRHPVRTPPQTRVEDTVLDLTDAATDEGSVIDIVMRACQRRLTTAARLALRARGRKRLRWRWLVTELLAEVQAGVLSALERRYFRDVERAHGLPRGTRNLAEGPRGRRRYRDVRYRRWRVVVELDGRAAHPEEWRELDDLRDNDLLADDGTVTLRYGWRSVTVRHCATAGQVGRVLMSRGWSGSLTVCGPACTARDAA
jgi:hypothetical protein